MSEQLYSSSWDCDGNVCFDPGTGNGQFSSLIACESVCIDVSNLDYDINSFNIFPNPSNGTFNIVFNYDLPKEIKISVSNTIGKIIKQENINYTWNI